MERKHVVVAILAGGVMNHGPSIAKHLNREFANWILGEEPTKAVPPLRATSFMICPTVHYRGIVST